MVNMGKRLKEINWKSYNRELVKWGSITFWFPEDVADSWYVEDVGGRGFQPKYSDAAIEVLSIIRFQFHLTLRSTQGFAQSLVALMGLDVEVPLHS